MQQYALRDLPDQKQCTLACYLEALSSARASCVTQCITADVQSTGCVKGMTLPLQLNAGSATANQ